MIKYASFLLSFFLFIQPACAMEADNIELFHINTKAKLKEAKAKYPELDIKRGSEGRVPLPQESAFTDLVEKSLKDFSVQGIWIVLQGENMLGTVALNRPVKSESGENRGYSGVSRWLKPEARGGGG